MTVPTALLIEPKASARAQVQEALEDLNWDVVPAESVDEAARVVEEHGHEFFPVGVVVCNYDALLAASWPGAATGVSSEGAPQWPARDGSRSDVERDDAPPSRRVFMSSNLRESRQHITRVLRRLRALVDAVSPGAQQDPTHALIVVTSDEPTPVQHEAALAAGATAYLSEADAARASILQHYFTAFGAERNRLAHELPADPHLSPRRRDEPELWDRTGGQGSDNSAASGVGGPAPSLAQAFRLAAPDLREDGYLSIRKIADYLDVPRQELAAAIGVKSKAASARPAHPSRDARLRPFEEVIALVRDAYAGDHGRVRAWLRTPRPELSRKTPLAVLLEPGHVQAVQSLVEGAWLGTPD